MTILLPTEIEAVDPREGRVGPSDASSRRSGGAPYWWARIDRSDEALLDFDIEALELDVDRARALLARHPTTYRNHLTIAKFIDGWVARITNDAKACRFNDGFVQALVEMAGHLRDGDFAVEPGDEVGYGWSSQMTGAASTTGGLIARGSAHQPRRTS
jgi:hypothetical protein